MKELRTALSDPDIRWNFWTMGIDIAFYSLAISISSVYTILPLFVHQFTKENWPIALISSLRTIGQFVPPLLIAGTIEKLRRVKKTMLYLSLFERLPYAFLMLAVLTVSQHATVILIIFFTMITALAIGNGLTVIPWLDFVARAMPDAIRGRFLGWWIGAGYVLGIGGGTLAATYLAIFPWPYNFAACFGTTFFFVTLSYLMLTLSREPHRKTFVAPQPAENASHALLLRGKDLLAVIREDHLFRRYIISNAILGAAQISSGLIAVVGLKQAHLTNTIIGLETTVLTSAIMIGSFIWGGIGDHFGHRIVIIWSATISCITMIITIFATNPMVMTIVFVLFGIALAGFQLTQLTYVVEFGPPERRPIYMGITNILYAPFAAGSPILGGILADRWGYTPVFAIGAVLAFAAFLAFWLYVKDPQPQQVMTQPAQIAFETH